MDWSTWHGGGMWIFWAGVVVLFTLIAWWGNHRMTVRRRNERDQGRGRAPEGPDEP